MLKSNKTKLLVFFLGKWINVLYLFSKDRAMELTWKYYISPRKKSMSKAQLAWLSKASQSYMLHNDKKIKLYHWPGNKKSILFLHGWESHSGRWKPLASRLLEQSYEVFLVDAPGHGHSEGNTFDMENYAKVASKIVMKNNIKILVGHSAGGYAAAYSISKFGLTSLEKAIIMAPTGSLRTFTKAYFEVLSLSKKVRAHFYLYFKNKFGIAMDDLDLKYIVPNIKIPTLVIHDVTDDLLPIMLTKEALKSWPEAKFVATKNYGHRLQSEEVYKLVCNEITTVQ